MCFRIKKLMIIVKLTNLRLSILYLSSSGVSHEINNIKDYKLSLDLQAGITKNISSRFCSPLGQGRFAELNLDFSFNIFYRGLYF